MLTDLSVQDVPQVVEDSMGRSPAEPLATRWQGGAFRRDAADIFPETPD